MELISMTLNIYFFYPQVHRRISCYKEMYLDKQMRHSHRKKNFNFASKTLKLEFS